MNINGLHFAEMSWTECKGMVASIVRVDGLPGLRGGANADKDIEILGRPKDFHQAIIGSVIKDLTSPAVRQWHTHGLSVIGDVGTQGLEWTRYSNVKIGVTLLHMNDALDDFSRGAFLTRNGVSVVNMSISDTQAYPTPCDNDPRITGSPVRQSINDSINRLRNQGVLVVVASRNTRGTEDGDNHVMPFPACMSNTVAVSALSDFDRIVGAVSTHTDFVAWGRGKLPGANFSRFGTSFATPRVVAQLAELKTLNPTRNMFQVLNTTRQTSDVIFDARTYGNKTITWQVFKPNFARARNSTIDSFWNEFLSIPQGQSLNGAFGWNYGTSKHRNGALSYFTTETIGQANNVAFKAGDPATRFSFKVYDIDTSDELEVLVNDKSYGYIKTTGSNTLSSTRTICIDNADLAPVGNRNEVKLKLKNSGETWGVTNLKVEAGVVDSSCRQSPNAFPPLPENDDRIAGLSDPVGNAYQLEKISEVPFDLSLSNSFDISPTPTTYDLNTVRRDVRVSFTTRSGNTSATDNGTIVQLNNQTILTTENYFSDDERSYEIVINRNDLRRGNNRIKFKPRDNSTNAIWGMRGISIEYIEPVELVVGTQDASTYGYNESPTRFTGLRANFTLTEIPNDYGLTLKGWDIDSADETEVFINGWSVGFLDVSANNSFNFGSTLVLPKERLKVGDNQIELMQLEPIVGIWWREGDEEWGVKELNVALLKPDLIPTSFTIDDRSIQANKPFSVTTVIQNSGAGIADASFVWYYVSEDETITTSDTYLERRSFSSLASGASVSIINEVQSAMVNKGYFIGVCIAPKPNEVSTANNCSRGIEMSSLLGHLPAILLILDD